MSKFKLSLIEGERDHAFYVDMGPFFASRAIAKELGEPLYDAEGVEWIIAKKKQTVVGWASFHIRKDGIAVSDWSYVDPDHRQEGLWTEMHERKLEILKERGVEKMYVATRDEDMKKAFKKKGFTVRREKGTWIFYEGAI